jgi:hypothetical protein
MMEFYFVLYGEWQEGGIKIRRQEQERRDGWGIASHLAAQRRRAEGGAPGSSGEVFT